ncbi:hypothetical protein CALCODRAFT_57161 [Calocera cornea HHB12733]|uniref:Uncharacterized protein n=1 Tax=Calocera cornea HHB12733 TaxID=1353952 RepID=A0A165IUF8_9BASI|nr:hypothetical protein CALCODRAFT_57161 [Calocera cornea HHB12733]
MTARRAGKAESEHPSKAYALPTLFASIACDAPATETGRLTTLLSRAPISGGTVGLSRAKDEHPVQVMRETRRRCGLLQRLRAATIRPMHDRRGGEDIAEGMMTRGVRGDEARAMGGGVGQAVPYPLQSLAPLHRFVKISSSHHCEACPP